MNRTERHDALFIAMRAAMAGLAAKVDAPPFPAEGEKEDGPAWVLEVLRLANARMVRSLPGELLPPVNAAVDGVTAEHYRDAIGDLRAGLAQLEEIEAGRGYSNGCAICGDDHHAGACHHNPLLLAAWGREALLGPVWKCFHCGCVFTEEAGARNHFGDSIANAAACVREQAEVLTYRAEQLTTLRARAPEISEDLARAASALRGVRSWLVEARS